MFRPKAPPKQLTREELIVRHRTIAESELERSGKAGRLEAQTVHATRATAHATLALAYIMDADEPDADMADRLYPPEMREAIEAEDRAAESQDPFKLD